jgi:hypothetical protein
MVRYHGIGGNGIDQFRDAARCGILHPPAFKSGDVVLPCR